MAEPVTERAHPRDQRSQPEGVPAADPLQRTGIRPERLLDRREADGDDGDVELDHEPRQAQRQQRHPPSPGLGEGCGRGRHVVLLARSRRQACQTD